MRNIKYLLIIVFLLMPAAVIAETITTGDAYVNTTIKTNANNGSVESHIESNVQSSGGSESSVSIKNEVKSTSTSNTKSNTYKKIEVNVNGEKKVVESNTDGEIKVEMGTKKAPSLSPKPTEKKNPSPTPPKIDDSGESITQWVKDFIDNLFAKLFK